MNAKVVEIREFLDADSDLIVNLYQITKIVRELENELHFTVSINKTDYDYMNLAVTKIKSNLEKVNAILKLQD